MHRALITVVIAAILGGGGVYVWYYYGGFTGEQTQALAFIDAYGEYVEVANQVEFLVHLPGVEGNNDRAELLTLLNSILTDPIENARREELSKLAFSNLSAIKKEVDEAQSAQAKMYEMLQKLDDASRVFNSIQLKNRAMEIVSLARKHAELAARITSVLSETNDQTYAILSRTIWESGNLSAEHIKEINEATETAEKRFETLSGLYDELTAKKNELKRQFEEFAHVSI